MRRRGRIRPIAVVSRLTTRSQIRFVLDEEIVELEEVDPTRTVLQFLREDVGRKGSKEGCAEGDCGACTVVLAEVKNGVVHHRAVNSCIQFLATLDGKELITVESLSAAGEALHPVQQAMVDEHGSQCGFCTPGFVMSLYALYETHSAPDRQAIDDALAGNLCRCTGYRPIIAAAQSMYETDRAAAVCHPELIAKAQSDAELASNSFGRRFFAPRSMDRLAELRVEYPDATLLAGGTDVGLWVTKQHRELDTIIYTGAVADLARIDVRDAAIEIGAAATLTDAVPPIVAAYPGLAELFRRFASPPIRNAGTLGGNIANGSPIGDAMAALMVLGTRLVLRCGEQQREIALDDFYHDYMVNDLQQGEWLALIKIPLHREVIVTSQKWSKRFDQDISAVCSAYCLQLQEGRVSDIKIAYGGLAAVVKRARKTEAALVDQLWNDDSIDRACSVLAEEFAPLSDMRASAAMRRTVTQNLLRRFYAETQDAGLQTVYCYGR